MEGRQAGVGAAAGSELEPWLVAVDLGAEVGEGAKRPREI
jgi:hypothetical protein